MKVLLIDNGTKLLDKLQKLIPGSEITKKWNDSSILDTNDFDLIMLSGSSTQSVHDGIAGLLREVELIRTTQKPIIGICFGCELIAYAFGGTLRELEREQKGIQKIKILNSSFYNKKEISVYECHKKAIEKLPKDFEVLAESSTGPEIIKHLTKPIYGFQFHPENFVDEAEGDDVFLKLFEQIKK